MRTFQSELESVIFLNKALSEFVQSIEDDQISKGDIISAVSRLHNVCHRGLTMLAHNYGLHDGIYDNTENRIVGSLLRDGRTVLELEFKPQEQALT